MLASLKIACVALLFTATTAAALAEPPMGGDAELIVKQIDELKIPRMDATKRGDRKYVEAYLKTRHQAILAKNERILRLYRVAPTHSRVPALLLSRWSNMSPYGSDGEKLFKEIDEAIKRTENPRVKIDGTFVKAQARIHQAERQGLLELTLMDEFLKLAPKDERAAQLVYMAYSVAKDEKIKLKLEGRLLSEFANTKYAAAADCGRRQRLGLGKPFHLEFSDVTKGSTVSVAALKGKVVVIDFWATWCGPCVAEIPHLKELYSKYRDHGVEFIGVSLDEPKDKGGLDKLKEFVARENIPWPQYYQGNGWDSDFSRSWGITMLPTVFVVDKAGKLYSVEAKDKLITVIPELLKRVEHPPKTTIAAKHKSN